jgi:hypothetical protein
MTFVPPTVLQFFTALFQFIYTLRPPRACPPRSLSPAFIVGQGPGEQTQLLGSSIVVERALKQVVFGFLVCLMNSESDENRQAP